MSIDVPTGVGGATNAEYVTYHSAAPRRRLHTVYRDTTRPSHLVLRLLPL